MVSRHIVDLPIFDQPSPTPPRCPCKAMMSHLDIEKAHRRPSQHVRLDLIDRIGPGSNPQTTDCVPACPPIDLYASSHMENRMVFQNPLAVVLVVKNSTANSDLVILLKFKEGPFKIVGLER